MHVQIDRRYKNKIKNYIAVAVEKGERSNNRSEAEPAISQLITSGRFLTCNLFIEYLQNTLIDLIKKTLWKPRLWLSEWEVFLSENHSRTFLDEPNRTRSNNKIFTVLSFQNHVIYAAMI
jgi:hypothetical protein